MVLQFMFLLIAGSSARFLDTDTDSWRISEISPSYNTSTHFEEREDSTKKWNKLKDEVDGHWQGISSNKVFSQRNDTDRNSPVTKKRKSRQRNISRSDKHIERKESRYIDYDYDYRSSSEEESSISDEVHKIIPFLLKKYRPKRLHLYTNKKLDIDRSDSNLGTRVRGALNNGRFPPAPFKGVLTPSDVIGRISTVPLRPCHGPDCHQHHKGLVRFYWRRVIFPRNKTRQPDIDDYDDEESAIDVRRPRNRQRGRARRRPTRVGPSRRTRRPNRGRNRVRDNGQDYNQDDDYDYYEYEEDTATSDFDDDRNDNVNGRVRGRNRVRNKQRGRNRQRSRNRFSNSQKTNSDNNNLLVYKDRIDAK